MSDDTSGRSAPAATIEWLGDVDADFFNEANWEITAGSVGGVTMGPPPPGTIDPLGTPGFDGIAHDLIVGGTGIADFSDGDILLAAELGGTLTVRDSARLGALDRGVLSTSDVTQSLFVANLARVDAIFLDSVQAEISGEATLALNGPLASVLAGGAMVNMLQNAVTPLPRPCIKLCVWDPEGVRLIVLPSVTLNGDPVSGPEVQVGTKGEDPEPDPVWEPDSGTVIKPPVIPDVDLDNMVGTADLDRLVASVAVGDPYLDLLDINLDGTVALDDLSAWLVEAGALNLGPGREYLAGDANLDAVVDVSDFNVWNEHKFADTGLWSQGDFNADGVTDVADFNVWNSQKFTASAAVPEPGGLLPAAALGVVLAFRRRSAGGARATDVPVRWQGHTLG